MRIIEIHRRYTPVELSGNGTVCDNMLKEPPRL